MSISGLDDMAEAVVNMSAGDVLSFVESQHAARLDAERNILQAAFQWAVLHHPDRLPASDKRGRDRAKPAGAAGTPRITEHAAAAFGARIQTSPYGARRLVADAVDIALRLPRLDAGIKAGTVRVPHARHVADATRDLCDDEAAWVDSEVAESADGRLAWTRFEALVEGKVAAAAPELTRAREEHAARERYVRKHRTSKHGMSELDVRADTATIEAIDAAITALAEQLKQQRPDAGINDRRVAALALLANPATHAPSESARLESAGLDPAADPAIGAIKPKVTLFLHLRADSAIARLEGHGPVTTAWVRQLLAGQLGLVAHAPHVRVRPVIDLNQQAAVDDYEIPARLREQVHLLHPGDVFPYAANLDRRMDLDHQISYAEGGPTSSTNLGPTTRTHHRIKTHHRENGAGWQVRQPFPGIIVWRDPYGAHYLVDHTGTRQVTGNTTGDHTVTPADISTTQIILNGLAAA